MLEILVSIAIGAETCSEAEYGDLRYLQTSDQILALNGCKSGRAVASIELGSTHNTLSMIELDWNIHR